MNIFLTSSEPRDCAQALDDKRVVKMALETAQLLASACLSVHEQIGYKPTHVNHPCAKWARSSRFAFQWLIEHGLELCEEYEFRYDRRRIHASKAVITEAYQHRHLFDQRPPAFDFNCSGFDTGNLFVDYQMCLVNKWRYVDGFVSKHSKKPKWTYREAPAFRRLWWCVRSHH